MQMRNRRRWLGALWGAACVAMFGCSSSGVQQAPGVDRVEITPQEASLAVGETLQLEVTAYDREGGVVRGESVSYSTSAAEVATVSASGVLTAVRQGEATITATVRGVRGTMQVEVLPGVVSVRIEPDPVEMLTQDTLQLQAMAFDVHGNPVEGKRFTWSVENTRVVTVDEDGVLTSLRREDTTEVVARTDGVEGRAKVFVRKRVDRIDVLPPDPEVREKSSLQLEAVVRDDGGQRIEGWEVSWTSSDPEIASIDGDGLVQGNAPGVVEITAEAGGVQETVELEVKPERVHRLEIEPGEATLRAGDTLQFRARTYNQQGEELFGRAITWLVHGRDTIHHDKARAAAPVDENGVLSALRPVRGLLTATVVGDAVSASVPFDVVLRMEGVSAGRYHTCALTGGGQAWCWGRNASGEGGRPGDDEVLPMPVETDLRFRAIAAGVDHTCALDEDGIAYCWGANDHGQLGDGTRTGRFAPAPVARPANAPPFARIYAGDAYSCALDTAGRASCWGANFDGRLGAGSLEESPVPTAVLGEDVGGTIVPIEFAELSLGGNPSGTRNTLTCGVSTDGVAYCWGANDVQASGIGAGEETLFASQPVRVEGGHTFLGVGVGRAHACGLTTDGEALCWGDGALGQLGDGNSGQDHRATGPVVVDTEARYTLLAAGGEETCALTAAGAIDCWGGLAGAGGQTRDTPARVGQDEQWLFESLTRGEAHTCGIDAEQVVSCWGSNFQGQLGNDDSENRKDTPTKIFPEN